MDDQEFHDKLVAHMAVEEERAASLESTIKAQGEKLDRIEAIVADLKGSSGGSMGAMKLTAIMTTVSAIVTGAAMGIKQALLGGH